MSQYHKLYTPDDSAIAFIDHQPANRSEESSMKPVANLILQAQAFLTAGRENRLLWLQAGKPTPIGVR
jgi:hypothetical protein